MLDQLDITRDAFLGGRVNLSQPARGFRAGLDTVLLAAAVDPKSTRMLELGAGAGAAACCAMADLPDLHATLAEREPELLALADRNIAENGFAGRAQTLEVDVTARGAARAEAGLKSDHYTSVIANPPFFDSSAGTRAAGERAGARHMANTELDLWVKTAATSAAPGGEFIIVHPAAALPALLAALGARFGAITVLPLMPRPEAEVTRVLIRGIKGSKAPFRLLAPLVLHGETGNAFAPGPDAIFRGRKRLDW